MKSLKTLAAALGLAISLNASALTIDTNAGWDGSVNNGWLGSGQSLTVDAVENQLDSIGFYFDSASLGQTFNFSLADALSGGTVFFSTAFTVVSGINIINIGESLTPNSLVYALIDYNGFSGSTAHFSNVDSYAGGQSVFLNGGWNTSFTGLDHRFIAEFSGGQVPEPASLALFGIALAGIAAARKRN